jgi:energy-coupling factor transporter ATP-binding protein EcfA2
VFFEVALQRRELVVWAIQNKSDDALDILPELDIELVAALNAELASLALLASTYKPTQDQTEEQGADAKRLSELEARKKFSSDVEAFVERRRNLELLAKTKLCLEACASSTITAYITRMRRQQLTPTLRDNFKAEIKAFDLEHLPLDLSDRGQAGISKVQVGLEVKQQIKRNSDILSEGEKRALALAGFLAELKEVGAYHGVIIDDPVSSLDHSRIEAVAKRLVEEAKIGRQVIIFTHNLVFHHAVKSAARGIQLREEWIAKHSDGRFGIVDEGQKPWVSMNCKKRLSCINSLLISHKMNYSETDESNRSFVVGIYTKLRETWEHSIEELLFAGVIGRFRPEVQTLKLRAARIEEADYQAIFAGMTRCSKFSGHDQPIESPPDLPKFKEVQTDYEDLAKFVKEASERHDQLEKAGKQSEATLAAEVM